jgi:hypothetical protein
LFYFIVLLLTRKLKMKVSKLAVTGLLVAGMMGVGAAHAGKKMNALNDSETQTVSMAAMCSVANQKFSDLMTQNPKLRSDSAKMADGWKDVMGLFMSDPSEVRSLITYANSKVNRDNLPSVMATCIEMAGKLGK